MPDEVMQMVVLAGCMAFIGLLWYLYRPQDWEWFNYSPKRRGKMLKRERRKFVKQEATYGFVSFIEDQVATGTFTRSEASELYVNLKKLFPIRELFPSTDPLKEAIRNRIQILKNSPPIPFPDRKKKRHLFDKDK